MASKRREKEFDREISENKKHRKTIATNSNDIQEVKMVIEDVYANVIRFEEEESMKRPAEKDSTLFLQTCDKLKTIFSEITLLKTQTSTKAQEELRTKRVAGSFLFAVLKKLSRLDKVRLRAGRDALHKEKLMVDSNKLQLQNLLYEADHLRREVKHCLQFKSQDEEIDLVDEEKFFAEAPESISRPDQTRNDEHARRLARLEWELHQRKDLAVMCRDLQSSKETVAHEIESKTNRLQSLIPCLGQLLKATLPLQDALDINIEKEWAVEYKANLLPRPLYVAFVNLSAYAEVSNELIDMCIVGDEDEARELENIDKIICTDDNKGQDSSQSSSDTSTDKQFKMDNDVDDDDPENDSSQSRKKHHHRRQVTNTTTEVDVYKPHPLSISFKIPSGDPKGPSLVVIIYYLPALRFVTVQTKLIDFQVAGIAARDVLDSNGILNCLVSNDNEENGVFHPKTKYTLHHLSLDSSKFFLALGEHQLGKPFTWAQNLCGLNYIANNPFFTNSTNYELTQDTVPIIIDKMHTRLKSRLQLYLQILALEKKTFDELLSSNSLYPSVKLTCILAQWSAITFNEMLEKASITSRFIDENLITENHLLYHAVIIRGSAKMDCFVSVSPNFPSECPIWAISLNFHGQLNALNSPDIKEMEFWVNSIGMFKHSVSNILVLQLKRAMCSLDVFLETESIRLATPANEFKAEKTFLKIFRSRTRSRPYKVVKNGGSILYTQT